MTLRHDAILLAAGGSRRLGRPKQLLSRNGVPLVRFMTDCLLRTKPARLVVVTGGYAELVRQALDGLNVQNVFNPEWETGLASSLRRAAAFLAPLAPATLIAATDQPLLTSAHLRKLLAHRPENGDIVTQYAEGGKCGIPVCLSRNTLAGWPSLRGDAGFRALWTGTARPAALVAPELARDLDTQEDFRHFREIGAIDGP